MKKENGITLIALVITIIVLLILAGVSIAMLTGDNGILTKASNANDETRKAEIKEAISLATSTIIADQIDPTITTAKDLTYATIAEQITKDNVNAEATSTTDGIIYTYAGKKYTVVFDFKTKTVGSETVNIGVNLKDDEGFSITEYKQS